jgi:hypothetical protein
MDASKGPLTRTARLSEIRLESRDGKLIMLGRKKIPAELGEWAFVQLCGLLDAPETYLRRRLPPTLIAQCLNSGLSRIEEAEDHDVILVLCAADEDDDAWTVRSISKKPEEGEGKK